MNNIFLRRPMGSNGSNFTIKTSEINPKKIDVEKNKAVSNFKMAPREYIKIRDNDLRRAVQGENYNLILRDFNGTSSERSCAATVLVKLQAMMTVPSNYASFVERFSANVKRLVVACELYNMLDYNERGRFDLDINHANNAYHVKMTFNDFQGKEIFTTDINLTDVINEASFKKFTEDKEIASDMEALMSIYKSHNAKLRLNSPNSRFIRLNEKSGKQSNSREFLAVKGLNSTTINKILHKKNQMDMIGFCSAALGFLDKTVREHQLFNENYDLLDFDKDFFRPLASNFIVSYTNALPEWKEDFLYDADSPLPTIKERVIEVSVPTSPSTALHESFYGEASKRFKDASRSNIASRLELNIHSPHMPASPVYLNQASNKSPLLKGTLHHIQEDIASDSSGYLSDTDLGGDGSDDEMATRPQTNIDEFKRQASNKMHVRFAKTLHTSVTHTTNLLPVSNQAAMLMAGKPESTKPPRIGGSESSLMESIDTFESQVEFDTRI